MSVKSSTMLTILGVMGARLLFVMVVAENLTLSQLYLSAR
jgi:hypothetical protein